MQDDAKNLLKRKEWNKKYLDSLILILSFDGYSTFLEVCVRNLQEVLTSKKLPFLSIFQASQIIHNAVYLDS